MLAYSKRALEAGDVPTFALYVRQQDRYALYLPAGEPVTHEIHEELDKLGYPTLHVHPDERKPAMRFLGGRVARAFEDPNLSVADRARLLLEVGRYVVEEFAKGPTVSLYARVADLGDVIATASRSLSIVREVMLRAQSLEAHYAHAVHVAAVASNLASRWLASSAGLLSRLATACLVRDVGMVWVPPSLWNPGAGVSSAERRAFESHVTFGLRILAEARVHDPLVTEIVTQHHERIDGSGFPAQLRGDAIGPFVRVAATADRLNALLLGKAAGEGSRLFDVLQHMIRQETRRLDPTCMRLLVSMLGATSDLAKAA
ncbi:MAG: HD domain-containing protein [Myxococcales bacterium]|nr:HD domain-containing protein [Myxococcales bacterium]